MSYPEKDSIGEQFQDVYDRLGGLSKRITNLPSSGLAPISLSYSEAQDLANSLTVSPGQLYLINNMGDMGMLLTGIDSTHFSSEGIGGFDQVKKV